MYSISQVIEALPEALIGGIYWGLAQVDDGQVYDMVGGHLFDRHPSLTCVKVMSIGWNPFYENKKRTMETHIVHKFEEADLYGRQLKVVNHNDFKIIFRFSIPLHRLSFWAL